MAKNAIAQSGEPNKSESIRLLLQENPTIKATEAVSLLAEKGVKITSGHFYVIKGAAIGRKKRRKKREAKAVNVVEAKATKTPTSHADAVGTILKVKAFANEIGGIATLKELLEALAS